MAKMGKKMEKWMLFKKIKVFDLHFLFSLNRWTKSSTIFLSLAAFIEDKSGIKIFYKYSLTFWCNKSF